MAYGRKGTMLADHASVAVAYIYARARIRRNPILMRLSPNCGQNTICK